MFHLWVFSKSQNLYGLESKIWTPYLNFWSNKLMKFWKVYLIVNHSKVFVYSVNQKSSLLLTECMFTQFRKLQGFIATDNLHSNLFDILAHYPKKLVFWLVGTKKDLERQVSLITLDFWTDLASKLEYNFMNFQNFHRFFKGLNPR